MQKKDTASEDNDKTITVSPPRGKPTNSSHIVTAGAAQAEEVPTIPLGPLQTLNTLEPAVSVHSVAATRAVHLPAPLVVQPSEYRRSLGEWLQVWWEGIRPGYVLLAILPVLVGSTLAWTQSVSQQAPFGSFHFLHFIAALVVVMVLQIGANLVNDYYDYIKGVDTSNSLGPGELIQQGLIRPAGVLNFGLVLLVLASLVGAVIATSGGFYVYLFGVIGVLCAYFYSATSRSLSSLALGELVSFCIFGPLLTLGAYLMQVGGFASHTALLIVVVYSLPLGFLATAFVHANDMRDIESDTQARKRTLASLLGLGLSRILYIFLVLGAYAIILALAIPHGAPHLLLIVLWTLPFLAVAITGVLRADMPTSLHLVMLETLKLETYFTLLLIAALIIIALMPALPHLPTHILPF